MLSWLGKTARLTGRAGFYAELKYVSKSPKSLPVVRPYSSQVIQDGRKFRMAIIGSGPAGFYTAYKVMAGIQDAKVDMYEFLPVPFGLVRFGVAPDHPEVKNCQDKFTEVASSPNFNFIGNIEVGTQLPLELLKENYDAILFAYGASKDRKLGIPGEDKYPTVYSAREFVGWYNGLPECAEMAPDLTQGDTAVIIGQGNVALDVARILLTSVDALRKTDIAESALALLAKSKVRNVRIVGRRGPMQAAFTIKEARELMHLFDTGFILPDPTLLPPVESRLPRTQRRMVALLRQGSIQPPENAEKSWTLDSMLSPIEFAGNDTQLKATIFTPNDFADPEQRFQPDARVTSSEARPEVSLPCSVAFRSIGYKSTEIAGMASLDIKFNQFRGIIPNDGNGRILGQSSVLPGLYCAGWVKRGPAGVIANTMEDSFATADAITSDWNDRKTFLTGGDGWDAISSQSSVSKLQTIAWRDWLKIDAAERARGKLIGKEREKFTSVHEMLSIVG